MKVVNVALTSIDEVNKFVALLTPINHDFDLVSGRYVVDAKSILGIFSLDMSKPVELHIHCDDEAEIAKIEDVIKDFIR